MEKDPNTPIFYIMTTNLRTRDMKRAIHDFFFSPYQDTRSLAFFRIGLSVILFVQMISIWGDYLTIYGQEGLIRGDVATVFVPGLQITIHHFTDLMTAWFGSSEVANLLALRYVYLGMIVMLGMGLFTRFSAVMVWLMHLAFVKAAYYLSYGVDYMHTFMLFYCIIFPVGNHFSLDARLFKLKEINPLPYLRLVQLHLCVIYFFGGLGKALGPNWWNGESIWKSINRPMETTFDFGWMADYSWIPLVLGVGVIALELLYVVGIWIRPIQKYWLWSIIAMHVGIAIFMELSFFAATMIVLNMTGFYFYFDRKQESRKEENAYIKPQLAT